MNFSCAELADSRYQMRMRMYMSREFGLEFIKKLSKFPQTLSELFTYTIHMGLRDKHSGVFSLCFGESAFR